MQLSHLRCAFSQRVPLVSRVAPFVGATDVHDGGVRPRELDLERRDKRIVGLQEDVICPPVQLDANSKLQRHRNLLVRARDSMLAPPVAAM